ncbi:hypothetical protein PE36_22635 [Moritella sp. PE36]|uniref:hypothetical protein n=1 Tax=Moritella sp. PE36 TaxID=58051 RepID=UPI0001568E03|nr:hypothetical protein [Moritella sp. PE36]EDM64708.1 hypothetical protein PE36_22635 [Moritella sp. PE36]
MSDIDSTPSLTKGSKRKALIVNKDSVVPTASVESLAISDLVLTFESGKTYFKRLQYFGCPPLTTRGELKPELEYKKMHRDEFVRLIYRMFKPDYGSSLGGYANSVMLYIRWLDNEGLTPIEGDYFHNELIDLYMTFWGAKVRKGANKGSWVNVKSAFSWILKALNRTADAYRLVSIKGVRKDRKKTQGLDVIGQMKPLLRSYFRAFVGFKGHIEEGTVPTIHPIFDEKLFEVQVKLNEWTKGQRADKCDAFRSAVSKMDTSWLNQFSRIAAMITFAFTGQNTNPLLKLRLSDIVFQQLHAGKFILNMEKARAKYLSFDTSLGFSLHARRFMESWLSLSVKLQAGSKDGWLFPYWKDNGEVSNFIGKQAPHISTNRLTKYLGLPHVTPRILRQTKIDTLMKVTEDIYLVSMSANNEVSTVKACYSHGLAQDHERNLAASNQATFDIAKGKTIEDAVQGAKYTFFDVLSEYDYKRLREGKDNPNESQTPLGVRCQNNKKGAASIIDKNLKRNGVDMPEKEAFCTDFLGCFGCEYHKLVAAVEDIWLMLSFRETLTEMGQYPTVNSLPKGKYQDLCRTIDAILVGFKEVSEENYNQALEQQKSSPHPLYSTVYSLNDLMEVFK